MRDWTVMRMVLLSGVLVLGLATLAMAEKQAALGGTDGFVERMGAGARELGRGNTGTADTAALPGAYWNPGLLGFRRHLAVALHGENRDLDRAGGSLGIEGGAGARMGVGLGVLFRGDTDFQVVSDDDQNLGSASPYFMMAYLGLGYRLSRMDGVGFSLAFSRENLGVAGFYDDIEMVDEYQSPVSINIGWHRIWNERWSSGVMVRNLGLNSRLSAAWDRNPSRDNSLSSTDALRPKVLQVGVGYHAPLLGRPAHLWIEMLDYQVADTLLVFDPDWHVWKARLGFESEIIDRGFVRSGLDDGNPSVGLGYCFELRMGRRRVPLQVDYALVYEWEAGLWNPLSFGLRSAF